MNDTPEHRAAVYAQSTVPEMREWAKQDFLEWLERHDAEVRRVERERLIRVIDKSPAVLWSGVGGVKDRIERIAQFDAALATAAGPEPA